MSDKYSVRKLAIIGDYPPRKCGIATFTKDLFKALGESHPETSQLMVPINDIEGGYNYSEEVRFEIDAQSLASYRRAADFLNISNVDVVCVQHEFGIYGGTAGRHLLNLLRDLRMPVVTTLHTLPRQPTHDQQRVMKELIRLSSRLIVMANLGKDFLRDIYEAPDEKIDIIPHGIPDMPFVDPNFYKDQFGVEGKSVLFTFGLLSPNKGIENVLKALPDILVEFPNAVYIVLGATHPNLLREEGENYRLKLERLAKDLDIEKNVIFYNRFVELDELKDFLGAADIYITPYTNPEQITSGTLAYSFGCGKAVISTPYWHAEELLADGRGVLVPFHDCKAIAKETLQLLRNETQRHAMRKAAYMLGRSMTWDQVAAQYYQSFEKARREPVGAPRASFATRTLDRQAEGLPQIKLDHVERMSDSTGIFQHAKITVPNFFEGYCTDDNARALILTVLLEELGTESPGLRGLTGTYLAFLSYAFNPQKNRFRNFLGFDRKWEEEIGTEDSHGRAIWALGTCVGRSRYKSFQTMAGQLFEQALAAAGELTAPRALAFVLIGIHEYLRRYEGDRMANQIREQLTDSLISLFECNSEENWPWFENVLTYDNAKLAHALLLSGKWSGNKKAMTIGERSLSWLFELQTSKNNVFCPIGSNGFLPKGGVRAFYDQQPIEAHAMISAALEAYRQTENGIWYTRAEQVFEWFLGRNDLGLSLYDAQSGGCCDGLMIDRVNSNQGSESTLAFLLSLVEMQALQEQVTDLDFHLAERK